VVANILTEILIKLRNDLYSHLNTNGILILSGILSENKSKVSKTFTSRKLSLLGSRNDTDWTCLIFQKQL
ncbi:MAG: 50S ribosomal protein L11 methyltransferase, partial [Deltaproteobacteria bacterium]|nr:50S ribosomal protein L11 methyltransferase [Deltaproteobacteria bacterium]